MLSQSNKTAIIVLLIICAILIELASFLFVPRYETGFADFLFDVGLTHWGWLPALVLGISSVVMIVRWKPGGRMLQVFLILLSSITVVFAALWLIIAYRFLFYSPSLAVAQVRWRLMMANLFLHLKS